MATGRIAPKSNPVRIDAKLTGLGAHELDGRLYVIDRFRIDAGLGEPIFDGEHAVTIAREIGPPVLVGCRAAVLPTAAVDADDQRRLGYSPGQVEIARELYAVVLDILQIGAGCDLPLLCMRRVHEQHDRAKSEPRCHRCLPASVFELEHPSAHLPSRANSGGQT